jgi:Domain of unknown function (DUF397)
MTGRAWRKSSYSGSEANCIEVADTADVVLVRDTKNREGVALGFDAMAWRAFTGGLKQA